MQTDFWLIYFCNYNIIVLIITFLINLYKFVFFILLSWKAHLGSINKVYVCMYSRCAANQSSFLFKNKETSKIHNDKSVASKSFRKYFVLRSMPSSTQRAWSDQNQVGAFYGSVNSKRAHPSPGIICRAFVILFWKSCKCPTVGL